MESELELSINVMMQVGGYTNVYLNNFKYMIYLMI